MLPMKICVITGCKGAGKDTFARRLAHGMSNHTSAFADPMKRMGLALGFPMLALWGDSDARKWMHPVLEISCRDFLRMEAEQWKAVDPLFWTRQEEDVLMKVGQGTHSYQSPKGIYKLTEKRNPPDVALVTDMRFSHEFDMVKRLGATTILIDRPSSDKNDPHASEQWAKQEAPALVDHVIINDGTLEEFQRKAETLRRLIFPC